MDILKKLSCFVVLLFVVFTVFNIETLTNTPTLWKSKHPNYHKAAFVKSNCTCKTNIVFLKTHKTGGTTVMNIIQRFGFTRNLTFVLPRIGLVYLSDHGTTLYPFTILPRPANKQFNILCNHVTYNKTSFQKIMPKNTVYITILRHPLQRFLSAFWFYSTVYPREYLQGVSGPDKLHTFLTHPERYESQAEYTHDSMSMDLGLASINFAYEKQILRHIAELDKEFSLVLILEYFEESLVLLKRQLCWSIKEILFVPKNTRSTFRNKEYKSNPRTISKEDIKKHKQWDKADFELYTHFYRKFNEMAESQGGSFKKEVQYFKYVKEMVSKFCTDPMQKDEDSVLKIKESQFNSPFIVTRKDCDLMLINHEQHFTRLLIEKQYPHLPTHSTESHYKPPQL